MKTNFLKRNAKVSAIAWLMGAMLLGSSTVFAQVKIGASPTTIGATNNLEVESFTPAGMKTSIDKAGKVTIKDGTEGTGKVFTSDAAGQGSWTHQRMTTSAIFRQTSGVLVTLPYSQTGYCNDLSCATDLSMPAGFTITNSSNDIVIDLIGLSSISNNTTPVSYKYIVAMDQATPNVFQEVYSHYFTENGTACTASSFNYKSVFKNLPVRAAPYQVKIFLAPWRNPGNEAVYGLGLQSWPNCGQNGSYLENLVVTVTQ